MHEKHAGLTPATAVRVLVAHFRGVLSLTSHTDYDGTVRQVRADAEFSSGNVWALVFAILIASIGLNVNSTAVIIGAMLISPLMGPIVGAGFALGTNDVALLRRSLRNLLLATSVALAASTLYFSISPLAEAQSELLARTRPTLYDVLIALFGGAAGVVAVSRKTNKGNVVPGVAIATALMPPLCTAGFGLSQGNWWFFLGALHLFLINAIFICLATLGFVRLMSFEHVEVADNSRSARVRLAIILITLGVALPSIYTGWSVIQEARFERSARRFVAENLRFANRAVVGVELRYSQRGSTISATVVGQRLSEETLESLKARLASYGLSGTRLTLVQPIEGQTSAEQLGRLVRQEILEDLYKRNEEALGTRDARIRMLEDEVIRLRSAEFPVRDLTAELAALFPGLASFGIGRGSSAASAEVDTSTKIIAVTTWRRLPDRSERKRLTSFLERRLKLESLTLVVTTEQ